MRRRTRGPQAVLALLLGAALSAGVASTDTASASTLPQRVAARTAAEALLARVLPPPSGTGVAALHTSRLRGPAESIACTPLIDVARRWVVPNTTMRAVAGYLAAHPSPRFRADGMGRMYRMPSSGDPMPAPPTEVGRTLSRDVSEVTRLHGLGRVTLVYTIAPVPSGAIGVRADVEVVPKGANCTRS